MVLNNKIETTVRSLLCVKMTPHIWTGVVTASKLARETEDLKGAKRGRVKSSVSLLEADFQSRITTAKSQCKGQWDMITLPWKDGAYRALLATKYMDSFETMRPFVQAIEEIGRETASRYEELKAGAIANLGTIDFEFPTLEDIESSFRVDFECEPIQTGSDVRVLGLTQEATELVKKSLEEDVEKRLNFAVKDLGHRLKDLVDSFQTKVTTAGDGNKVIFGKLRKSVDSICNAVEGLNITGSAETSALIKRTRALWSLQLDTVDLAKDITTRSELIDMSSKLSSDIAKAFGG